MRQTSDFTCGPVALQHLLERLNIRMSESELVQALHTTPEFGTSHRAIEDFLMKRNLSFHSEEESSIERLKNIFYLPALVNFQCEEDGHYGVIESIIDDGFVIWDPWTGGNRWYRFGQFDDVWYSTRYGKRWFLHISPIQK